MLPVAGVQEGQRLGGVTGLQAHRLGPVVEDAAVGGQGAQAHHGTQRLVRQGLVVLVADGEHGVVDLDGPGADQHHVALGAEPVAVDAGGAGGDPAAGPVVGGAASVERGRELPGDERSAVLHREGPGAVQRPRLTLHQAEGHLDAGRAECPPRRRTRPGWGRAGRRPPAPPRPRSVPASTGRCARCGDRARGSRPRWPRVPRHRPRPGPPPRRAPCRRHGGGPRRSGLPSGESSTQPTRGLGPRGTPGVRASSSARSIARRSAPLNSMPSPSPSRSRVGGDRVRRQPSDTVRASSHPDFDRRSRSSTWSTDHWWWPGRGLSPPVRSFTAPRAREHFCSSLQGCHSRGGWAL